MPNLLLPKNAQKEREKWLNLVTELIGEIEQWTKELKWAVQRDSKAVHETPLGDYVVPVLSILAPAGRLQVDPVARYVAGGDGRVDLLAWPSLTRMLLVRLRNRWVLKTDSGVEWPEPWNKQTFADLVCRLNSAA